MTPDDGRRGEHPRRGAGERGSEESGDADGGGRAGRADGRAPRSEDPGTGRPSDGDDPGATGDLGTTADLTVGGAAAAMATPMWVLDAGGRVGDLNGACAALFDRPRERLVGTPAGELLPSDVVGRVEAAATRDADGENAGEGDRTADREGDRTGAAGGTGRLTARVPAAALPGGEEPRLATVTLRFDGGEFAGSFWVFAPTAGDGDDGDDPAADDGPVGDAAAGGAGPAGGGAGSDAAAVSAADDGPVGDGPDGASAAAPSGRSEVVRAVPDAVYATDAEGRVTFVNDAFESLLGYDRERVYREGMDFSAFTTREDVLAVQRAIRAAVRGGDRRRTVDVTGRTADGREIPLEDTVAPLPPPGEFHGVVGVLRDVSDRERRREVLSVMDRALRHNLRTHLTVIEGRADILAASMEGDAGAHVAAIRDSTEWLDRLGGALRTLQEAVAANREGTRVPVESVVEGAARTVADEHGAATVETNLQAEGDVVAGPALEHAVENVVENGVVHHDGDDPRVTVWTVDARREGWVDVVVEDDGPGIPDRERTLVLGEGEESPLQHGSGLGLWITRWVVETFGGELDIEADDDGTVVVLRVRRAGGG